MWIPPPPPPIRVKLCFFYFENLISLLPPLSKNSQKECVPGIDHGSCNDVEASDLPIQIWLNGGSIYFQLARAEVCSGWPTFSPVLLEELAPVHHHWNAASHDCRRMGSSGWPRYRPMDEVGTLGRHTGKVTMQWPEMEARYWRRRIMRQCEIGEINKDQLWIFRAHKNNQVRKRT
jgi:hypothetical protein